MFSWMARSLLHQSDAGRTAKGSRGKQWDAISKILIHPITKVKLFLSKNLNFFFFSWGTHSYQQSISSSPGSNSVNWSCTGEVNQGQGRAVLWFGTLQIWTRGVVKYSHALVWLWCDAEWKEREVRGGYVWAGMWLVRRSFLAAYHFFKALSRLL